MSLKRSLFALLCMVAVFGMVATAGAVTRYDGIDPGVGPTDPRPNSDAAAAAFDAAAGALPNGIDLYDFEGLALGNFATRELYTGIWATLTGTDPIGGIVDDGWTPDPPEIVGYNTTAAGTRFLVFVPVFDIGTATLTFDFYDPIEAFGAYLTGVGTANGDLFVEYADGGVVSMPVTGHADGGVLFFGFTDPGAEIVELILELRGVVDDTRDIWGLDDMRLVYTEYSVYVDIKPASCPNPLNTKSNGVLPVAILGTQDFDVTQMDPSSVTLEGVSPLRWAYEDVATPFEGELCDCHELGPDGYMDLTLKFATQEIVLKLGAVTDGEYRELFLTVEDYAGLVFTGSDCVWIKHKVKDTPPPPPVIQITSFDGGGSTIYLSLADRAEASVVVHDVLGRRVKTLVNGALPAGNHTLRWDGRDEVGNRVASGVYFCHVQAGAVNETGKIVMMK